ncbi:shikimate kinase, chloroplastic [Dorcoceras hygrometricum]|uniref:Shikimate kinase, chloroplastic n=1 Tax=Dorcoceras hygrometricum TaxID=472368 RepID=A0A2Z7D370_9LAMI|nr:shikimate kinase, chloroplastic [Dorcoceras hygrometricum]
MTSALMSSQSAEEVERKAEATSYFESADEAKCERRSDVVLRFSRWINIDDVIGDVIQSQESAGSLHSRRKRKRRRIGDPVASYSAISRCYLKIAKRCRLHKLIRQRFALAINNSAGRLCVVISADEATVIQSQRKDIQSRISRRCI